MPLVRWEAESERSEKASHEHTRMPGKAENLTQIFSFQGQFVGIILLLFLKGKKLVILGFLTCPVHLGYFSDKFVKLN